MPKKRERKPSKLRASTSVQPERPIHPNIYESLVQAIKNTNFVTLVMRDQSEESGEPHVYGQRDGHPMVLLYNDETDPTWQLIEVRDVKQVKIGIDGADVTISKLVLHWDNRPDNTMDNVGTLKSGGETAAYNAPGLKGRLKSTTIYYTIGGGKTSATIKVMGYD